MPTANAAKYYAQASLAVKHVRKLMDIGASNRLPHSYLGWPARMLCVKEMREKVTKDLADLHTLRQKTGLLVGWQDQLDMSATWAKHYGCGNCGEYSALAFVYLRDVAGVRPLDWMDYDNMKHAFVIVGRAPGSAPVASEDKVDSSALKSWGDDTVFCDAYYDTVLYMSDLTRHLAKKKLRLLHAVS